METYGSKLSKAFGPQNYRLSDSDAIKLLKSFKQRRQISRQKYTVGGVTYTAPTKHYEIRMGIDGSGPLDVFMIGDSHAQVKNNHIFAQT